MIKHLLRLSSFRWDHLQRFQLRSGKDFPGFQQFQNEGIRTEYIKSVFPAESFPTWQTINTGMISSKSNYFLFK